MKTAENPIKTKESEKKMIKTAPNLIKTNTKREKPLKTAKNGSKSKIRNPPKIIEKWLKTA